MYTMWESILCGKAFICTLCGKAFTCTLCGKAFTCTLCEKAFYVGKHSMRESIHLYSILCAILL